MILNVWCTSSCRLCSMDYGCSTFRKRCIGISFRKSCHDDTVNECSQRSWLSEITKTWITTVFRKRPYPERVSDKIKTWCELFQIFQPWPTCLDLISQEACDGDDGSRRASWTVLAKTLILFQETTLVTTATTTTWRLSRFYTFCQKTHAGIISNYPKGMYHVFSTLKSCSNGIPCGKINPVEIWTLFCDIVFCARFHPKWLSAFVPIGWTLESGGLLPYRLCPRRMQLAGSVMRLPGWLLYGDR